MRLNPFHRGGAERTTLVSTGEAPRVLTREERVNKLSSCLRINAEGSKSATELLEDFRMQFHQEEIAYELLEGVMDYRSTVNDSERKSKLTVRVEGLVDRVREGL